MACTITGTLSHELGHIAVAKMLGYKTTLHYGSMEYQSKYLAYSNQLYKKYRELSYVPEAELNLLNKLKSNHKQDGFWITLAGPIQSMLTGMIGLIILWVRKNKNPKWIDWIAIFLAFFWARPIFNLGSGLVQKILNPKKSPFGGDEAKLSNYYDLPPGFFGILAAAIGLLICTYVVFYFIPKNDRLHFILSGILGSSLGFLLWFEGIGPIILP